MDGVPEEILYDRMKTAVIGEDEAGVITYNASCGVAEPLRRGAAGLSAVSGQNEGKGRTSFPLHPSGFFLARTFRNLADLNAQFDSWRTGVANPRVHATTRRIVNEAFDEERPCLKILPHIPYSAVLTIERRVSHEGMVSVDGNYYSVPDTTRKRVVEVQNHTDEVRIFEQGVMIARHPVLEGKNQRRVDPAHRKAPPVRRPVSQTTGVPLRSLTFYDAVGRRLAAEGARS